MTATTTNSTHTDARTRSATPYYRDYCNSSAYTTVLMRFPNPRAVPLRGCTKCAHPASKAPQSRAIAAAFQARTTFQCIVKCIKSTADRVTSRSIQAQNTPCFPPMKQVVATLLFCGINSVLHLPGGQQSPERCAQPPLSCVCNHGQKRLSLSTANSQIWGCSTGRTCQMLK